MKALTYIEHGKFALLDKPKPVILDPRDAVVRVTLLRMHQKLGFQAYPGKDFPLHCIFIYRNQRTRHIPYCLTLSDYESDRTF